MDSIERYMEYVRASAAWHDTNAQTGLWIDEAGMFRIGDLATQFKTFDEAVEGARKDLVAGVKATVDHRRKMLDGVMERQRAVEAILSGSKG